MANDNKLMKVYTMASDYLCDESEISANTIIKCACDVLKDYPQFSDLYAQCMQDNEETFDELIEDITAYLGEYFAD